eukprot:TRINITY_DN69561_c0_g1_i1.p1 TRINITY_DN69561_c0_g1~~TRINITY_DN69561_c0_g1_i1.p1  ORF type:complete len:389 (-),score=38.91 TRINITY_DN69561_c0_g1_i1:133-1299(-)
MAWDSCPTIVAVMLAMDSVAQTLMTSHPYWCCSTARVPLTSTTVFDVSADDMGGTAVALVQAFAVVTSPHPPKRAGRRMVAVASIPHHGGHRNAGFFGRSTPKHARVAHVIGKVNDQREQDQDVDVDVVSNETLEDEGDDVGGAAEHVGGMSVTSRRAGSVAPSRRALFARRTVGIRGRTAKLRRAVARRSVVGRTYPGKRSVHDNGARTSFRDGSYASLTKANISVGSNASIGSFASISTVVTVDAFSEGGSVPTNASSEHFSSRSAPPLDYSDSVATSDDVSLFGLAATHVNNLQALLVGSGMVTSSDSHGLFFVAFVLLLVTSVGFAATVLFSEGELAFGGDSSYPTSQRWKGASKRRLATLVGSVSLVPPTSDVPKLENRPSSD